MFFDKTTKRRKQEGAETIVFGVKFDKLRNVRVWFPCIKKMIYISKMFARILLYILSVREVSIRATACYWQRLDRSLFQCLPEAENSLKSIFAGQTIQRTFWVLRYGKISRMLTFILFYTKKQNIVNKKVQNYCAKLKWCRYTFNLFYIILYLFSSYETARHGEYLSSFVITTDQQVLLV